MFDPIKFEIDFTYMILEVVPLLMKFGFVSIHDHEFRMKHMANKSAKALFELFNVYNTMYVVYLV